MKTKITSLFAISILLWQSLSISAEAYALERMREGDFPVMIGTGDQKKAVAWFSEYVDKDKTYRDLKYDIEKAYGREALKLYFRGEEINLNNEMMLAIPVPIDQMLMTRHAPIVKLGDPILEDEVVAAEAMELD